MLLDLINKPNDIKKLSEESYENLAQEIRDFLIHKISISGGHLASNLGVVELTMAMHLVCDLPKDKMIQYDSVKISSNNTKYHRFFVIDKH